MRKQFWDHCCKFRFVGQAVTLENCRIVKNALNAVVSLFAQPFFGFGGDCGWEGVFALQDKGNGNRCGDSRAN